MKSKATIIFTVLILLCAAVYIGIYIGRTTSNNTVYLPDVKENTNTQPEEDPVDTTPIDLNAATVASLCEIPGITPALAEEIIAYREEYGNYVDIDELLEVEGMTEALYMNIKQYVTVDDSIRRRN